MELLSQLFVTIFGVLFGKMLDKKDNKCNGIRERVTIEHIERIEIVHTINDSSKKQTNSDGIWIVLIAIAVIIYPFVKYQKVIGLILILSSVILEIMTMYIVYIVLKRGWKFGRNIQSLIIYNMLATVAGIAIIVQMEHPIFFSGYSSAEIINCIEEQGIVRLFFEQYNTFLYITLQISAIVILCIFMFSLLLSNISIWAMIRIVVTGREKGFWNVVYNKVGKSCKKTNWYIKESICLLICSFIFMSGVLVKIFEWLPTF